MYTTWRVWELVETVIVFCFLSLVLIWNWNCLGVRFTVNRGVKEQLIVPAFTLALPNTLQVNVYLMSGIYCLSIQQQAMFLIWKLPWWVIPTVCSSLSYSFPLCDGSKAAVPNLFGTRDHFRGRQFFYGLVAGSGGGVGGMVQAVMWAMGSGRWSFARSLLTSCCGAQWVIGSTARGLGTPALRDAFQDVVVTVLGYKPGGYKQKLCLCCLCHLLLLNPLESGFCSTTPAKCFLSKSQVCIAKSSGHFSTSIFTS